MEMAHVAKAEGRGAEMTGEQLKPLEGRPYLQQWQERMAAKPAKPVKKHKGRKKAKK